MLKLLIRSLERTVGCHSLREKITYFASLKLLRSFYAEVRFTDVNGNTFYLHPADVIDRELLVQGVWEEHVTDAMKESLEPGAVFYDIGANFGYNSMLASRLVGPDGRVIAFEPSPMMAKRFRRHAYANAAINAQLVEACVTPEAQASITLYVPPASLPNPGRASVIATAYFEPLTCKAVCLDDLIESGELPKPNVIKIDVEGFERQVLRSLERFLRSDDDVTVLVEITTPLNGVDETSEFLRAVGFTLRTKHNVHELGVSGERYEQFDAVFRRTGC